MILNNWNNCKIRIHKLMKCCEAGILLSKKMNGKPSAYSVHSLRSAFPVVAANKTLLKILKNVLLYCIRTPFSDLKEFEVE